MKESAKSDPRKGLGNCLVQFLVLCIVHEPVLAPRILDLDDPLTHDVSSLLVPDCIAKTREPKPSSKAFYSPRNDCSKSPKV